MLEGLLIILGVCFLVLLGIAAYIYASPFINNFSRELFNKDELAEYHHALTHAQENAKNMLSKLDDAGLIDSNVSELVEKKTAQIFSTAENPPQEINNLRYLYTVAMRIELEELDSLKKIGLVPFYTYTDIKNTMRKVRDEWLDTSQKVFFDEDRAEDNFFKRTEAMIIGFLREKNWAAKILSKYQYQRLSARLRRNIAGVLMSKAVLDQLSQIQHEFDPEHVREVEEVYTARIQRRKQRIDDIVSEYPDFYLRYETRLLAELSLIAAKNDASLDYQKGMIGSKVYSAIEKKVIDALNDLPKVNQPIPKMDVNTLIGKVPLLNGLEDDVLEELASRMTAMHFLEDDIVIGKGDHGDALYIIHSGQIDVYRDDDEQANANLYAGDFFGEMGLLGDHVRTATAKASMTSTVLRLKRQDIIQLAEAEPELKSRLQEMQQRRQQY